MDNQEDTALSSLSLPWAEFLAEECLPEAYRGFAEEWFLPLAQDIAALRAQLDRPLIIGINGCQGSGKTTLGRLLVMALGRGLGLSAVDLSLDDFYLTRSERAQLASRVHPLLATRGVPGTHDVALMCQVLTDLTGTSPDHPGKVSVPRFDKASDDRTSPEQWHLIGAPVDVVILEGWCLGVVAQAETALQDPVNNLEATRDPQGIWRRYVNQQLTERYGRAYDLVDRWVMLAAPGFSAVQDWRLEQEHKLAADRGVSEGAHIMSDEEVIAFIQHYQRLTEWALEALPGSVHYCYQLDTGRNIVSRRQPLGDFLA